MNPPLRRAMALLAGWALFVGLLVVIVAIVLGAPLWLAVAAGLVGAVGLSVALHLLAPAIALRVVGAIAVEEAGQPRLRSVVEGVCVAQGLAEPALFVTPGAPPNALVVAGRSASLVVTDGLIGQLRRIEVEGVVAHLLARARSGEARAETLAVVVAGIPLARAAHLRVRVLRWILGDDHALRADLDGVGMTRYPPGLAAALARMERHDGVVRSGARAAQHLWVSEPATASQPAVHRRLSERIEVLQEL